jgi:tellurite resistance protein TehA-like permease
VSERSREFTLSAVLMVAGFALNAVVTLTLLPSEEADDHVAIFTAYADSGAWVAAHLVQFVAVLLGLAGLFVLARALRPEAPHLAALAAAGAVTTAAAWAFVQAVDGVALKLAIDAWVAASGPEEATRFANAEAVLWTGWGAQSFFYGGYGLTLALLGVVVTISRRFGAWLGWVAVTAGLLSLAIGIDVAYRGSETGFYELAGAGYQLLILAFVLGILVAEVRPGASQARRSARAAPATVPRHRSRTTARPGPPRARPPDVTSKLGSTTRPNKES